MKILVTGGAGFIGSHFSESALNAGHEVFVIDDLSTGSIENIEHLKPNPHFHYYLDSVTNRQLRRELIDKCHVVVRLAAAGGVQREGREVPAAEAAKLDPTTFNHRG